MNRNFIEYRGQRIAYWEFGLGQQWVLALHGYGEDGSLYASLAQEMADTHRFLCLDLPLHGETSWELPEFKVDHLLEVIVLLQQRYGFVGLSLAGFSMGGRLAAALACTAPAWLHAVWLFAPDGWKPSIGYQIATQTKLGNRFFRYTMHHPGWLFLAFRLAAATGLMHASLQRFLVRFISTKKERILLYKRWTMFSDFRVQSTAYQQAERNIGFNTFLFLGKYDRVIPLQHAIPLQRILGTTLHFHVLDTGHRILDPQLSKQIAALLLSSPASQLL